MVTVEPLILTLPVPELVMVLGWAFNKIFDEVTVSVPVLNMPPLLPPTTKLMVDDVRALKVPELLKVAWPVPKVSGLVVKVMVPELV